MPTIQQAQQWYPGDDPVHGFEHVLRVYTLARALAQAEGADLQIVEAAALLHDAEAPQPSADESGEARRAGHHQASADFAGTILAQEGWSEQRIQAVQHAIRAHRFRDQREPPQTLEAQVLFDADKLDAIGAIGVARAIAYAARQGEPAYVRPSAQFLDGAGKAPGERHSAYHEYCFKLVKLKERLFTATAKQWGEERHQVMVAFFETLAREVDQQG